MAAEPIILDADPIIPTGVPATKEQVAAMIADPGVPISAADLARIDRSQRPTPTQLAAAEALAGDA